MNRFLPHAITSLLLVVGCSDQSVSSQPLPPPDASPDAPPEASDAGQMPTSMITIDLGTVEPGIPTTFVAPKGTLGFNVVAVPSKGAEKAGIKELISPDGTKHVRGGIPERASFPFFYSGFAATGIPRGASSVAMTDKSGKWSVTFHGSSPLKASVHLQVTSDGRFHGGDLDLHSAPPSPRART